MFYNEKVKRESLEELANFKNFHCKYFEHNDELLGIPAVCFFIRSFPPKKLSAIRIIYWKYICKRIETYQTPYSCYNIGHDEVNLMLFLKEKKKTIEEMAISAQKGDEIALNQLINDYKPFIKKTVSSVCKHYINDSDDEFSIGLIAFNDAILKFDPGKGASLLAFSEVIIKRKVIDYIRSNSRYKELSLDIGINDDEVGATQSFEDTLSFDAYQRKLDDEKRKEEIIRFQGALSTFGLNFKDLIQQSPKHEDARVNAINVAKTLVEDPTLLQYMNENKRLPMKLLEKKVDVSRKTLERNRKYIMAITLIMTMDFIYLKDYLKGRLNE